MLQIKNLKSGYDIGKYILKGVDISIEDNEVIVIFGQNGSGKSTIAKSIMGLVPFMNGEITFNGTSILGKNTAEIADMGIGYFMQGGRIFPHLTVQENLDFAGTSLSSSHTSKRKEALKEYFDLFKNQDRYHLKASYLSGGEQHQLALAMVLMKEPKLLILDEPSAGLSPKNATKIFRILHEYFKNEQIGAILIEQNIGMAVKYSKIVGLLHEGHIMLIENNKSAETLSHIEEILFNLYKTK